MGKGKLFVIVSLLLIVLLVLLMSLAEANKYKLKNNGALSPLSHILSPNSPNQERRVIGFLPYWNLNKLNDINLSQVDTIHYFALDINADGTFNKKDPGWTNLSSPTFKILKERVKNEGKRLGLTIVNLDQDSIAKNTNNNIRRANLAANTVKLMKDEGFQDLNIDLEYVGPQDQKTKENFSLLIEEITSKVRTEIPNTQISFDVFADSAIKPRIFDLSRITKAVDHIVVMAYDFHRLNAIKAGPVAPLFGKEKYDYDIFSSVSDFLQIVPSEKLILGVPFYGYEWPTMDNQQGSFVIWSTRKPEISSYRRSLETAAENNANILFDDFSKSPWFSYYDSKSQSWRQVWFENERSLGLKLDLVNQGGLGGIAIFALGYDGKESSSLWNTIREKFP